MTIEVMFCHACGRMTLDQSFDELEGAALYALRAANDFGAISHRPDTPTEVRVVEDGLVVFAIKVTAGGLLLPRSGE